MSLRRRVQWLVLLSLLGWELWEGLRAPAHPWGDLQDGVYSDHFSHMNVARAFPRLGLDIWRKPIAELFRPLTASERAALPADVASGGSWSGDSFFVPGWPEGKPLVAGWTNDPRLYPPGHLLVVAPVAILYHRTGLPFAAANRLLLMLFVLGAHLALWMVLEIEPEPTASPRIYLGGFALLYGLVTFWTLNGFFDGVVLLPLAPSARALGQKRPLASLFWYCVAAFFHFRVYFFAPIPIVAAVELVRMRFWQRFGARDWLALLGAALLGVASLGTFALVWGAVKARPADNLVNLGAADPIALSAFLVGTALCTVVLWRARARFDAAVGLWLALMTVLYRYFCPWHAILAFLPWLFLPLPDSGDPARIRAARLGFVVMGVLVVLA